MTGKQRVSTYYYSNMVTSWLHSVSLDVTSPSRICFVERREVSRKYWIWGSAWTSLFLIICSRRSDCGNGAKRCEREKQKRGSVILIKSKERIVYVLSNCSYKNCVLIYLQESYKIWFLFFLFYSFFAQYYNVSMHSKLSINYLKFFRRDLCISWFVQRFADYGNLNL